MRSISADPVRPHDFDESERLHLVLNEQRAYPQTWCPVALTLFRKVLPLQILSRLSYLLVTGQNWQILKNRSLSALPKLWIRLSNILFRYMNQDSLCLADHPQKLTTASGLQSCETDIGKGCRFVCFVVWGPRSSLVLVTGK